MEIKINNDTVEAKGLRWYEHVCEDKWHLNYLIVNQHNETRKEDKIRHRKIAYKKLGRMKIKKTDVYGDRDWRNDSYFEVNRIWNT